MAVYRVHHGTECTAHCPCCAPYSRGTSITLGDAERGPRLESLTHDWLPAGARRTASARRQRQGSPPIRQENLAVRRYRRLDLRGHAPPRRPTGSGAEGAPELHPSRTRPQAALTWITTYRPAHISTHPGYQRGRCSPARVRCPALGPFSFRQPQPRS